MALDDHERDAFVRHLDGVSVPQLVSCKSSAHTCRCGCVVQLFASRNSSCSHAQRSIPTSRRFEHMSTIKEQQLQIRVGPTDKALLERAAAASHLNVSAFVVPSVRRRSRADTIANSLAAASLCLMNGCAATQARTVVATPPPPG